MTRALTAAIAACAVLASGVAAAGDRAPDHLFRRSDKVMGTIVNITVWTDDDRGAARATETVFEEFRRIDALMTSWTDDSAIARINAAAGARGGAVVDEETYAVVERALEISRLTKGAFDVSVGAFHNLWKFGSSQDGSLPSDQAVDRARALVNYKWIKLDPRRKAVRLSRKQMGITLGGIAKGYAVDRAVSLLHERNFVDFIIQIGGDLYISGQKGDRPWVVGIRDPRGDRSTPFAITPVRDRTFSTSGDYERAFIKDGVRYHHILDPDTGRPARKSRSVTVMAKDAMTADGLSTALFVMGVERGMKLVESLPEIEAVFVDAENRVHVSSGLKDSLRILAEPTPGI